MPVDTPSSAATTTDRERRGLAARHDRAWLQAAHHVAGERIATAAFTLLGLLVMGWEAAALAMFVLATLLIELVADVALWLLAGAALGDARQQAHEDDATLAALRRSVDDADNRRHHAAPLAAGTELAIAGWTCICLVGAVVYELQRTGGVDLLAWAGEEPLTLLALAGMLAWQIGGRVRLARRAAAAPASLRPGTDCFTPLLDAIIGFVVLFLWLAGMTIAQHVAAGLFGQDLRPHALAAFVAVAHGVALWRGIGEWRAADRTYRDARERVCERAAQAPAVRAR